MVRYMANITFSIPDNLKGEIIKEHNYSGLISGLIRKWLIESEEQKELSKAEEEAKAKAYEARLAEKKSYRIEFCTDYLFELFEVSRELAVIMAEDWVDNKETYNEKNIHSWALKKELKEKEELFNQIE